MNKKINAEKLGTKMSVSHCGFNKHLLAKETKSVPLQCLFLKYAEHWSDYDLWCSLHTAPVVRKSDDSIYAIHLKLQSQGDSLLCVKVTEMTPCFPGWKKAHCHWTMRIILRKVVIYLLELVLSDSSHYDF